MQNSTYKTYKVYTREFLEWIQKKYKKIQKKAANKISWNVLNDYRNCIDQITQNYRVLNEEEENEVFHVLKSIEKAVKFRKQMNELFYRSPDSDEAREENEKHLFFIAFLQECFQKLKDWVISVTVALKSEDSTTSQSNHSKFAELEDLLEMNLMEEEMTALSLESKRSSSFNLDEIEFNYGELKFSMISLLLDIVSLGERVNDSWRRLSLEKISVITATMVNFTAIKEIKALEKAFQLFYPSCKSALDFFLTLQKHFPSSKYPKMYQKRAIREYFAILLFFLTRDGTCYASYTVLDPKEALSSNYFKLLFPEQYEDERFKKEFLQIYSEISKILSWSIVSICLLPRTDHLLEADVIVKGNPLSFEDIQQTFVFHFTQPFERARELQEISLLLIFTSWTLIQSIQILTENDENGIRKLGYYCSYYTRKRLDNYNHSHIKTLIEEKGLSLGKPSTTQKDSDVISELLSRLPEDVQKEKQKNRDKSQEKEILEDIKKIRDAHNARARKPNEPKFVILKLFIDEFCAFGEPYMVLCHNPYLYGCLLFKSIYYDLNSSAELVYEMNCHSRLIAMLYSALKTEGYLTEEIPILEYFLKEFGIRILRGSFPKSGEYQSKFYSINPYYNRTERASTNPNYFNEFPELSQRYFSGKSENFKLLQRENQKLQQVSSVFPYEISAVLKLAGKNKEFDRILEFPSRRKKTESNRSISSFGHELIDSVEEQFELELFHHRYLSLDFTLLFESFYEVVEEMYKRIPAIDQFITQHFPTDNVYESILMHGALLEMEIFHNLLAAELDRPKSVRRPFTNGFVQDIVRVLQDYFSSKSYEDYFILPPTPKYKEILFGSACSVPSPSSSTLKSTIAEDERIFNETMTTIDEKLYSVKKILPFGAAAKQSIISSIKNDVKLHPNIVKYIRKQPPFTPQGIRYPYFPTLLDHALSGKLQDQDFVEWLVAMGGLQLFANRSEIPNANEYPADLPSQLQLAFQSGNYSSIFLLLAETKGKTIPYQNEISGNTVFHYFSMNIYKFNSENLEKLTMVLNMHSLSSFQNKAGIFPCDYLPQSLPQEIVSKDHFVHATMVDMMAKDRGLLKKYGYDEEQIRGPTNDYHNKQAIDSIGMEDKQKLTSTNKKAKKMIKTEEVQRVITEEDEKKAKSAERELLELLENEDKQQPKKKQQQPTKKGGKKK